MKRWRARVWERGRFLVHLLSLVFCFVEAVAAHLTSGHKFFSFFPFHPRRGQSINTYKKNHVRRCRAPADDLPPPRPHGPQGEFHEGARGH